MTCDALLRTVFYMCEKVSILYAHILRDWKIYALLYIGRYNDTNTMIKFKFYILFILNMEAIHQN